MFSFFNRISQLKMSNWSPSTGYQCKTWFFYYTTNSLKYSFPLLFSKSWKSVSLVNAWEHGPKSSLYTFAFTIWFFCDCRRYWPTILSYPWYKNWNLFDLSTKLILTLLNFLHIDLNWIFSNWISTRYVTPARGDFRLSISLNHLFILLILHWLKSSPYGQFISNTSA